MYLADLSGPTGVVNKDEGTSCVYVLLVSAFTATANLLHIPWPTFFTRDITFDFLFGWESFEPSSCSSSAFLFRLKKFIFCCIK